VVAYLRTSIVIKAGHRLRVHVTSSNFPRGAATSTPANWRPTRFAHASQPSESSTAAPARPGSPFPSSPT